VTTGLVLDFDASILAGYADGTAIGVPVGSTPWNSSAGSSSGTQAMTANRPTKQTVAGVPPAGTAVGGGVGD
jgi:hypothetical protein